MMSSDEKKRQLDQQQVSDELRKIIERDLQTPDSEKREPLDQHQHPIGFDDDGKPFLPPKGR